MSLDEVSNTASEDVHQYVYHFQNFTFGFATVQLTEPFLLTLNCQFFN